MYKLKKKTLGAQKKKNTYILQKLQSHENYEKEIEPFNRIL